MLQLLHSKPGARLLPKYVSLLDDFVKLSLVQHRHDILKRFYDLMVEHQKDIGAIIVGAFECYGGLYQHGHFRHWRMARHSLKER